MTEFLNFFFFVSKVTMNSLNSIYNFKSQDRKGNKFVTASLSLSFLTLLIIAGFNVVDVIKDTKTSNQQIVDVKKIEEKQFT